MLAFNWFNRINDIFRSKNIFGRVHSLFQLCIFNFEWKTCVGCWRIDWIWCLLAPQYPIPTFQVFVEFCRFAAIQFVFFSIRLSLSIETCAKSIVPIPNLIMFIFSQNCVYRSLSTIREMLWFFSLTNKHVCTLEIGSQSNRVIITGNIVKSFRKCAKLYVLCTRYLPLITCT